ncbi:MAG: SDR family oxidoreductase [Novosphingobium sp.]|nr:SDR family oxidoreductase [Novosphingobium sp.]
MELTRIRHALVTGGASGIGLGIVDAFAERGIAVTVADIIQERLDQQFVMRGENIMPIRLDTRDREGWIEAKRTAETRFGPVDVLVNNAGIGPDGCEISEMTPDSFDKTIAINLTAVFNGINAFVGEMKARGSGHIVNTASMNGIMLGLARYGAYAASKFGVVGLSEALREELEPHGVGVSVLCPGPVLSNMPETSRLLGNPAPEQRWPDGTVGMEPIVAGRIVLRSIELNLGHILTHPNYFPAIDHRNDVIRQAAEIEQAEWASLPGWQG